MLVSEGMMCWAQAVGEMAQDWPHRSGSRVLLVSACPGEVRTGIAQHTVKSREGRRRHTENHITDGSQAWIIQLGGRPGRPVLQASLGIPVCTRQKVLQWLQGSHMPA